MLESGAPVSGVIVKAFDKDLFFDDMLGAVETGLDGCFSIIFEKEDFREIFESKPDLYLKVKTADRSKILYTSESLVRIDVGHEEYFDIKIPQHLLQENDMGTNNEIGQIVMKIDKEKLQRITEAGRLEEFAEKATAIFARDLKSELVAGGVSSVSTNLAFYDNDEFGTGPRPPHWHNIGKIDALVSRINTLEKVIGVNADILESKDIIR